MKVIRFLQEFWKDNKFSYLISCIVFSIVGALTYSVTENYKPFAFYLSILPLFWLGILTLAFSLYTLIYWRND